MSVYEDTVACRYCCPGSSSSSSSATGDCTPAALGLRDTGRDLADLPLPDSCEDDPNWSVDSGPPKAPADADLPTPFWLANGGPSRWLSPVCVPQDTAIGTYVYRLDFDIGATDPTLLAVGGRLAYDNTVTVFLNGVDTGITGGHPGFDHWTSFALPGDAAFAPGANYVEFIVVNDAAGGPPPDNNPGGLRVEWQEAACDGTGVGAAVGDAVVMSEVVSDAPVPPFVFRGRAVRAVKAAGRGPHGAVPRKTALPCIYEGPEYSGKERAARRLPHGQKWKPCAHPAAPLGPSVCGCQGCGAGCPGYVADVSTE